MPSKRRIAPLSKGDSAKHALQIASSQVLLRRQIDALNIYKHDLLNTVSKIHGSKYYRLYNFVKQLRKGLIRLVGISLSLRFSSILGVLKHNLQISLRFFDRRPTIIIFGIISYRYRKQRPQHIAEGLVKRGYNVIYVENGFVPFADPLADAKDLPLAVHRYAQHLTLISLVATRDISIYKEKADLEDKKRIFQSIDQMRRRFRLRTPVVIVQHPFWSQFAPYLNLPVIYDCMDEHAGFEDSTLVVAELENTLLQKSDLVVVTSKYLEKKMQRKKIRALAVINNAGENDYFSRVRSETFAVPSEFAQVHHPIIGYYGAVSHWFDDRIIDALSVQLPDATIAIIGEVTNVKVRDLASRRKNVILLGEKPYSTLLPYVQQFDVCLIPFKLIPLIQATNPVKIFEYFATGKPVVTTRLPELKVFSSLIEICDTPAEFVRGVKHALSHDTQENRGKRIAIAKQHTWAQRAQEFDVHIRELQERHRELYI